MSPDQQSDDSGNSQPEWLSRVTIIAVGVDQYDYLQNLSGPPRDLDKLHNLLVEDHDTALYLENQFINVHNPSSDELRQKLTDYAIGRSASHDILIFYFSGHAVKIGTNDLGLCTKDTRPNRAFEPSAYIPLNLVRYSDVIETLTAVKVDPVIILDTCFSGQAQEITQDIYSQLKRIIQAETGSAYALLCSSANSEQTPDTNAGGPFTTLLSTVAAEGIGDKRDQQFLNPQDLHPLLREEIETNSLDTTPQLFIGQTLLKFGFVRNVRYTHRQENLNETLLRILAALSNYGDPRPLSIQQISEEVSHVAYTVHSKLSYSPDWALVEGTNSRRSLTERGKQFVRGEIQIPYTIQKNHDTDEWMAAPDSECVSIESLLKMKIENLEDLLQDSFMGENAISRSDQYLRYIASHIFNK